MVSQQWEKVMSADLGGLGAHPSDRAGHEPSRDASRPSGDHPLRINRMSDPWHAMLAQACITAEREAQNGVWTVSGNYADNLGTIAMQEVANRTGLTVIPAGQSDYHNAVSFHPDAIATAAGTDETRSGSAEGKGAGRKASPKPNHIGETNDR